MRTNGPSYDTWIRKRRIVVFWLLTGGSLGAAAFTALHIAFVLFALPAVLFGYIATVISLTAWRFSSRGGGYQQRIHNLIADSIPTEGRVLDVGCGSGALLIGIAARNPARPCVGVDTWGADWEYSSEQCRRNAESEGVANVRFERASAASLPFDDRSFAVVVSCLTFHEVQEEADRAKVVAEALRVLEPGGRFVFLDLFFAPEYFGTIDRVTRIITDAGCVTDRVARLSEVMSLPFPLDTTRALKHSALISGHR